MESLDSVLERVDVKAHIGAFKAAEKKRLSDLYRKRFNTLLVASAWQRAYHVKAMFRLQKRYKITDESFAILNACFIYSHTLNLKEYFLPKAVWQHFFKGAIKLPRFNRSIKALKEAHLIHYMKGVTVKTDTVIGLRIHNLKRKEGTSFIFRFSGEGLRSILSYDRGVRSSIGISEKEWGEFKADRLDALYHMMNEFLEIKLGHPGFIDANFRPILDEYVKEIMKKVDDR